MFARFSINRIVGQRTAMAFLWTAIIASVMALPAAQADPPSYRAQFITPGFSAINVMAMNEAGDVVGVSSATRAWVSIAGAPAVLLPLPPGAQYSWATDVNDAGMIVGAAGPNSAPEFGGQAVAWIPDGSGGYTIEQLGALPGQVHSYATAVNNLDEAVGYSSNGTYRYPVLWTVPGGIQDLTATGIFDPADINDQRVVIDHSFTCKRLDLNTMAVEDLGVPAGPPSYLASTGAAINEFGQVAGLAIYACCPSCDRVAATYTDEIGWQVLSACGQSNGAFDLNDLGDVVMRVIVASYVRYPDLGTFLIEDLIVADAGHWYVLTTSGLAINNSRQMAVSATNLVTDQTGVLLLTPLVAGDLDGDGDVDLGDLAVLLADYGCTGGGCSGDIDGDGDTDLADLAALLANYTG